MGSQVSTIKAAANKLTTEAKKRGNRSEKNRIGILAFEVANVMSKSMQLWQSLNDQEVIRLRTEVIKAEGVLNLVSDSEAVLLSLACREKLQELTSLAAAVARLGKKCQDAALQGFEHVFNDVLKQNIDASVLEYTSKEMETKIKKMERYVGSTSNLYQELEILADLEQAVRRILEDQESEQQETLNALEQKIAWQRQEIKYLRDISLWNRTYDKIVTFLARTVCTIHGRIVCVFGSPMVDSARFYSSQQNGDSNRSFFLDLPFASSSHSFSAQELSNGNSFKAPSAAEGSPAITEMAVRSSHAAPGISSMSMGQLSSEERQLARSSLSSGPHIARSRSSKTRLSSDFEHISRHMRSLSTSSSSTMCNGQACERARMGQPCDCRNSSLGNCANADLYQRRLCNGHANGHLNSLLFDPKSNRQPAPASTLGGAALALHYSNVIILIEKMVRYPQLIGQDARDDLYRMLPQNIRAVLRARLKGLTKDKSALDPALAFEWRAALDRILGWLAPLAHNMIRWQSEHNFEQQVISRTNVLLLQTLYFADQVKAEAAITDLLVGLNYLCLHEKENKVSVLLEYEIKDLEEYLES